MASSIDFINFICEQIETCGVVTNKKMFGEYMIYLNGKPIILVCDDIAYMKINETTTPLLGDCETGIPYSGSKPYFIVDVDNKELLIETVIALEKITPFPKSRGKKK